jgi:hypothetical protein
MYLGDGNPFVATTPQPTPESTDCEMKDLDENPGSTLRFERFRNFEMTPMFAFLQRLKMLSQSWRQKRKSGFYIT